MEILDNINRLLGDDLKQSIQPGAKLRRAASCFSIYAFEALKAELESIDQLQFIFTTPNFVPEEVTDKVRKEHREFHIPNSNASAASTAPNSKSASKTSSPSAPSPKRKGRGCAPQCEKKHPAALFGGRLIPRPVTRRKGLDDSGEYRWLTN